jgi:hypothetical protein
LIATAYGGPPGVAPLVPVPTHSGIVSYSSPSPRKPAGRAPVRGVKLTVAPIEAARAAPAATATVAATVATVATATAATGASPASRSRRWRDPAAGIAAEHVMARGGRGQVA